MPTDLSHLLDDDDALIAAADADDETPSPAASADAAPSPTDADPEPASDPSADDAGGPPRDEHGRFAKKAPADAAPDDPSALPASATPTPPGDPAAPPAVPQPFAITADGREVPLEGAQVIPGQGLVIPEAQIARAHQLMSRGVHHETTWRQTQMEHQRTIRTLQQQLTHKSERDSLADRLFEAIERLPEDQMLTAILEFREALPQQRVQWMQQEIEALRSGKLPAHGTMPSLPEPTSPPDAETISHTLAETLKSCEAVPGAQYLTPEDWQALRGHGDALGAALVKQATEDLPQEGVLAGEFYFDAAPLVRLVQDRIALREQHKKAADAMAQAAKANAQQVKPTTPPPATPTKASTVAPAERGTPRSKADWERSLAKLVDES